MRSDLGRTVLRTERTDWAVDAYDLLAVDNDRSTAFLPHYVQAEDGRAK